MQQDKRYKQLEDALLKEADLLIEKAKSQGEKALYNLFKSAILKKYKNQYDVIRQAQVTLDSWKAMVTRILIDKGINVV